MSDIERAVRPFTKMARTNEAGVMRSLGLCPFHREQTSSFFIDHETNKFHCLGCGVGGDVGAFQALVEQRHPPVVGKRREDR